MSKQIDIRKAEKENKEFNPLHILCRNGWVWHHYQDDPVIKLDNCDDYDVYTLEILGEYTSTVRAVVSSHAKHLCVDGHFGVLWVDSLGYENKRPYCYSALEDMIYALELAEDNLLTIGMPFSPEYDFHGNVEEKIKKNNELRKLYHLDEAEKAEGY